MNQSLSRFFIALLPPPEIQTCANQIKQYFANHYSSHAALKSPPHITLQPPFKWSNQELQTLEAYLSQFVLEKEPFSVTLAGFAAFPPRVIYINVLKTEELLTLQTDLSTYLATKLEIANLSPTHSFAPHLTVGFRDLTRKNFRAAWSEFQHRQLHFVFTAAELVLLKHDGRRWNVEQEFPFFLQQRSKGQKNQQ